MKTITLPVHTLVWGRIRAASKRNPAPRGSQGAGFGPTGFKFKSSLGGGDMVDVIESLCFVEASPDWDEEKMGFPPVAMQHGYQLWIDHDQASQMSDDLAQ